MTLPFRIRVFNNLKNCHAVCLKLGDIFFFSPNKLLFEVEASISSISSCYRTLPSAIWEIFFEFIIFCSLFHEPLGE